MSSILQVLSRIWDKREQLLHMLDDLPDTLQDTGEKVEDAGDWVTNVSTDLSMHGEEKEEELTLSALLKKLSSSVTLCGNQLTHIASLLDVLGGVFNAVEIPTVTPIMKTLDLGFWKGDVVVGLSVGSAKLFGQVVDGIQDVSSDIRETAAAFHETAGFLRQLQRQTDVTATHVGEFGGALRSGGIKLQDAFVD